MGAWIDSQTDGLFVLRSDKPRVELAHFGSFDGQLIYFKRPSDWQAWKPTWQHAQSVNYFVGLQWLPQANCHAVFSVSPDRKNCHVELISDVGSSIAKFVVPGGVAGIEETSDGLEVYFATAQPKRQFQVIVGTLDIESKTVKKRRMLNTIDWRLTPPNSIRGEYLHPFHVSCSAVLGPRVRRIRGSESGDVRKFATQTVNELAYFVGHTKLGYLDGDKNGFCADRWFCSLTNRTSGEILQLETPPMATRRSILDFVNDERKLTVLTLESTATEDVQDKTLMVRVWEISAD